MELFETLIALLLAAAVLSQFSLRLRVPYPTILAIGGVAVAVSPWAPDVGFDPALALALFVAPALLSAAFDTSLHDLRRHWLPLLALVLFAVIFTTAAVAWLGVTMGGLPIAAAIALGAIVAPPDAAAAQAVMGSAGMPRRTVTILQGESLLNDAVALLIFGAAVAFSGGDDESPWKTVPRLALAVPGGIAFGAGAALVFSRLARFWAGSLGATIIEFTTTFALWIVAERIHVSPVLAVVTYAMLIARFTLDHQSARARIHSFSVWDAAVFILNVVAFLLMGLQAHDIVRRLEGAHLWDAIGFATAVFGVVVAVRMAWVMSYRTLLYPLLPRSVANVRVPAKLRLLVAWCGMRGTLTLATALSLPLDFPGRDLIVLSAFAVVLGTLIVQGGTVALLTRALKLPPDHSFEQEVAKARVVLASAGDAAEAATAPDDTEKDADHPGAPALVRIAAERVALNGLYREGTLPGDTFRMLQQELDWRELSATPQHALELDEG